MAKTRTPPTIDDAKKAAGHFYQWFVAKQQGDTEIADLAQKDVNKYLGRFSHTLSERRA